MTKNLHNKPCGLNHLPKDAKLLAKCVIKEGHLTKYDIMIRKFLNIKAFTMKG
jgi:hypothetical protein